MTTPERASVDERAQDDAGTRLGHGDPVAILELVPAPGVIGAGRRWVTQTAVAAGADTDTADVVELLTSELLTNAVQHGPAGGRVTVHVVRRPGALRVTVHDDGPGGPVLREADLEGESGRGLHLVHALAAAWGVEHHRHSGKSIWFETALATA